MFNTLLFFSFGAIAFSKPVNYNTGCILQSEIQLVKTLSEDGHYRQYEINQSTTVQELEKIRDTAIQAGISFEFNTTYRKGLLKKVDLFWELKTSSETSSCRETVSVSDYRVDKKGFTINWTLDENGKATDIYLK